VSRMPSGKKRFPLLERRGGGGFRSRSAEHLKKAYLKGEKEKEAPPHVPKGECLPLRRKVERRGGRITYRRIATFQSYKIVAERGEYSYSRSEKGGGRSRKGGGIAMLESLAVRGGRRIDLLDLGEED